MPNSLQTQNKARWTSGAQKSYNATLCRIAMQDDATHAIFERRVTQALALLATQPSLGTPTADVKVRSFAIPKTGHTLEYQIIQGTVLVVRWYRQRRKRS
ncbi:type II toxin-antitoxin system RelE/ParE family toxin [Pseudoduganella aquatica]|uniref:type II toxin-antitoxin system RelE/ParE family toxin n=1 Tax=Pseudoduganella aquatica TaxID=2660641 RepID=UPI00389A15A6